MLRRVACAFAVGLLFAPGACTTSRGGPGDGAVDGASDLTAEVSGTGDGAGGTAGSGAAGGSGGGTDAPNQDGAGGAGDGAPGDEDAPASAAQDAPADTPSDAGEDVAGSGRDAAPADLGASCRTGADCASGHCVDDVCCERACAGVCEACNTEGRCVMPADDPGCGAISCPATTTCRSYSPLPLTSSRCRSVGVCKTSADCTPTDTPARTPCGGTAPNQLLCDGAGECRQPSVPCGTVASCPTRPGQCCLDIRGKTATCQGAEGVCDAYNFAPFTCNDELDCPQGAVCCLSGNGYWSTSCKPAAECVRGPYSSAFILCNPDEIPSSCPSGTTCRAQASTSQWAVMGYFFCE